MPCGQETALMNPSNSAGAQETRRPTPSKSDPAGEPNPADVRERVNRGVQLCRSGKLEDGYRILRSLTEEVVPNREFPGVFFSFLGYGVAAFESRYNDGIALCQRSIEMEFYNAENHHNLARTYMLLGTRRKAVKAVFAGLRVDPDDRALRLLARELGVRRKPVLSFLSRGHLANRWLGSFRHLLVAKPRRKPGP